MCCVLLVLLSQGLLDGDSEMEDGEIESKVSVSVITSVCVCVQVTMEDSIVTVTDGSPAKSVKVCQQCYLSL